MVPRARVNRHACAALFLLAGGLTACGFTPAKTDGQLTMAESAPVSLELTGTGFFVDRVGHVLTAGHAATDCARLVVIKGGRAVNAELVARSPIDDLALLKVPETLGLPAVFDRAGKARAHGLAFVAGYQTLPGLLARGGVLSNAVITGSDPQDPRADIELLSEEGHGSSGAPVLGPTGLVIGVVTHQRVEGRVLATAADNAKAFLAENRIGYAEDDRPQLSMLQDRAHRAATISVRVICDKHG